MSATLVVYDPPAGFNSKVYHRLHVGGKQTACGRWADDNYGRITPKMVAYLGLRPCLQCEREAEHAPEWSPTSEEG